MWWHCLLRLHLFPVQAFDGCANGIADRTSKIRPTCRPDQEWRDRFFEGGVPSSGFLRWWCRVFAVLDLRRQARHRYRLSRSILLSDRSSAFRASRMVRHACRDRR
ncbi:unnamed protein product [Amoebophrya sp. A25]|nr:unnamed protein product [Amoebophrya sp. A25]|eukprot:GSA25T00012038001.1